jgi:DNA-directed RNA polymerase subunit RPC12/RpoP
MPAYIQYREIEPEVIVCPSCLGFPLHIRDVEPIWSKSKLDFIYECPDCGAEVRETVTKPERRH